MFNDQNAQIRSNLALQRRLEAAQDAVSSQKQNSIGQKISQRVPRSLAQSQKNSRQSSEQIQEHCYMSTVQPSDAQTLPYGSAYAVSGMAGTKQRQINEQNSSAMRKSSNVQLQNTKQGGGAQRPRAKPEFNGAAHQKRLGASPEARPKLQNDIRRVAQLYRQGAGQAGEKGDGNIKYQYQSEVIGPGGARVSAKLAKNNTIEAKSQSRERNQVAGQGRPGPAIASPGFGQGGRDELYQRKRTVGPQMRMDARHNLHPGQSLGTISHTYNTTSAANAVIAAPNRRTAGGSKVRGSTTRRRAVAQAAGTTEVGSGGQGMYTATYGAQGGDGQESAAINSSQVAKYTKVAHNTLTVNTRRGISKSTLRTNIGGLSNYAKNAPNISSVRKTQNARSVGRERIPVAGQSRHGDARPGQSTLQANHPSKVQLKRHIQKATYQNLVASANEAQAYQMEEIYQGHTLQSAGAQNLHSLTQSQTANQYIDNREATIQLEGQPRKAGAGIHVGSYQQELSGPQARIPDTLPNPELPLSEVLNPASIEEVTQSRAVLTQQNLHSKIRPQHDQIPQNYVAGQDRVLANSRGQPGQHQASSKPQLRQNLMPRDQDRVPNLNKKPSQRSIQAQQLRKFYQSSASRAESVPPVMKKTDGVRINRQIQQNQYASTSSGRLGGQASRGQRSGNQPSGNDPSMITAIRTKKLANSKQPQRGPISTIQQSAMTLNANRPDEGLHEMQYLDSRSKYQEQNILLGPGMSSQGAGSDYEPDVVDFLAEPYPNQLRENQDGRQNPHMYLPAYEQAGSPSLNQTAFHDSGIISNQFSFKHIKPPDDAKRWYLSEDQEGFNNGQIQSQIASQILNEGAFLRIMPDSAENVRVNNATSTKNSVAAKNGMNPRNLDRAGLAKMNFESLNDQDMQARMQYFQSCDHDLLLQVLQNQMQSSNFGPAIENDQGEKRGAYGINGEDVFNTEHMPLKDSQDLNLFNTDGNNDVNEYLYNDDGGAQAFEGIHENLQQQKKAQQTRLDTVLISQIIENSKNPNLLSINEQLSYHNRQQNFNDNLQNLTDHQVDKHHQRAHNETINSSNLVLNHRDRQNIKDFLSAHHSGVGLGGLEFDFNHQIEDEQLQGLRTNEKRDSANINIISEIFDTSQNTNAFRKADQVKHVEIVGEAQHNLDASHLKNTSANPLLNDSINRSQLSGSNAQACQIGRGSAYTRAHANLSNQNGQTSNGIKEKLNDRYNSIKIVNDQTELEQINDLGNEEDNHHDQQADGIRAQGATEPIIFMNKEEEENQDKNLSEPFVNQELRDAERQETGFQNSPKIGSILEKDRMKKMQSSNQDTDDEEMVDEILNSDREQPNENILMKKQNNKAIIGEKPTSETDQQIESAKPERADITQDVQDHNIFPSNHQNIKKLIPFKADDEDEIVDSQKVELPAGQDAEEMYDQEIAEQMSKRDYGGVTPDEMHNVIAQQHEYADQDDNSQGQIDPKQAVNPENRPPFIRKRPRRSTQNQQNVSNNFEHRDNHTIKNDTTNSSPGRQEYHNDQTINSTAIATKNAKDNLNNSKTTVSTLNTANPQHPNRKSTFLFGSRQGNIFAQNNLRYSQQNAAGQNANVLQKFQMKSVALNKINEISDNSNRPKFADSQVNNDDAEQRVGSEKKHLGGQNNQYGNLGSYNLNDYHKIDELQNENQNESECKYDQTWVDQNQMNETQDRVNLTDEKVNLMSINSNPLSQKMMANISKSNAIQGNQIISDFAIGEELLEFSEKVSSDPEKLNDKLPDQITEQYAEEQDNTHTSQSQSGASKSIIASQQEASRTSGPICASRASKAASSRYEIAIRDSLVNEQEAHRSPPVKNSNNPFKQKMELIQSNSSGLGGIMQNSKNRESEISLKVSSPKVESAEEQERQLEQSRSNAAISNVGDSMDNVMIQSFQSQNFYKHKQATDKRDKANEYIKQFENDLEESSTLQGRQGGDAAMVLRSSRTSDRNGLVVRHDSSDSPRVELEDSTGILVNDYSRDSGVLYARNSNSRYDRGCMATPGDGMVIGGRPAAGMPLERIRFGDGDQANEGLTQSKKSTPAHSDDEITPRRGLDEMLSDSKLCGLQELEEYQSQSLAKDMTVPNLNFTRQSRLLGGDKFDDSTRQNPIATDKIIKKLKAEYPLSDHESDLNARSMEASIVIEQTLKTQPKHMKNVNAELGDHMESSRILKARKGHQVAQGGDDRYSDSSSACNLLDSSRASKRSKDQPSSRRRQRYQEESEDEGQVKRQDMSLDSLTDLHKMIKLDR